MTQFKTDFSEYALDVKPSDWTNQWDSSGEQFHIVVEVSSTVGDKILKIDEASSAFRALSWDDVGTPSNVEIFTRIRAENAGSMLIALLLRGDGNISQKIGYVLRIFGDDFYVGHHNGGGFTQLDVFKSNQVVNNTWYNVRFRVSGEEIKVRVWEEHENEPSIWDSEVSDGVVSGEGWVGVHNYHNAAGSTDFFTVGTDGDSAPDPDYDPREIRVTQLPLEILKGGTPETRLTQLPLEVLSGTPTNRVYQDLVETLSEVSGERITKVYQDSFEVLSLSSPISGSKTVVMVIT